jgi:hypothetical protein
VRLDEEKLEALRSWGERLRQAGGEESVAVGRAILMLAEEIDRLHIELWHARMQISGREVLTTDERPGPTEQAVASSLHGRLQRVLRRNPAVPAKDPESTTQTDPETSARAWIDSLRRER